MLSVIPESESQKRIALDTEKDTEKDPTPHPRVSYGGSSASGVRPSATTSTDQSTSTSDAAQASSEEHIDSDVAMGGDRRDQTAEGGSRRRESHVKSELSIQAPLNSTFREGSWEDDASRTGSCCHHARGIGRVP